VAILLAAPGRFSIMKDWRSRSDDHCPIRRATISLPSADRKGRCILAQQTRDVRPLANGAGEIAAAMGRSHAYALGVLDSWKLTTLAADHEALL
jgi:hypothetical protein